LLKKVLKRLLLKTDVAVWGCLRCRGRGRSDVNALATNLQAGKVGRLVRGQITIKL